MVFNIIKLLVLVLLAGGALMVLAGCSMSAYTLRHELKQVLEDEFQGEVSVVKVKTERHHGTPTATGRQKVWLYDNSTQHFLFFYFVDAPYRELREPELGGNRTHSRTSRQEMTQQIRVQIEDLAHRSRRLTEAYQALTANTPNQTPPMFVHFGHTDRYRYESVSSSKFESLHPIYLNLLMPAEPDTFLTMLAEQWPLLADFLHTHPHGQVTLYPDDPTLEPVSALAKQNYWVSSGPPDRFIGSRPNESLWHPHSIYARVIAQEEAARRVPRTMLTPEATQRFEQLQAHQKRALANDLHITLNGVTADASNQLGRYLHDNITQALAQAQLELPNRRFLYRLKRDNDHWLVHFYATQQHLARPWHVVYDITSDRIQAERIELD